MNLTSKRSKFNNAMIPLSLSWHHRHFRTAAPSPPNPPPPFVCSMLAQDALSNLSQAELNSRDCLSWTCLLFCSHRLQLVSLGSYFNSRYHSRHLTFIKMFVLQSTYKRFQGRSLHYVPDSCNLQS